MPTLLSDDDNAQSTDNKDDVPFNEWSQGADLVDTDDKDNKADVDSELGADDDAESTVPTAPNQTQTQPSESSDDDYEATASQQAEEEDEEFQTDDYVDEVKMKREEDAEADKAEADRAKAEKAKNAKAKDNTKTLSIQTSSVKESAKRKTNARSPAAQLAGTTRKKSNVSMNLKTADSASIYKRVNINSNNRRTCNRLNDESVSTPERNNRWSHKFKTRATLRLRIPATEQPEAALSSILQEFVQELRKIDNSASILPWKESETRIKRIVNSNEVPSTAAKLRKYLKKFYVGKPNQELTIYPGIYLGHNKAFTEIREELMDWLESGNHAMFYMMLQAEDSSEVGWLLYTTREMDAGAMADEIADLVGIKVGLRWKTIDIGVKGKIPDAQKVNALTVEVESKFRWEAQQKLTNYFGRARKDICEYPNGVRIRFVKNRKDALNASERGKLDRLRSRQQLFLSKIQSHETWSILQLDYSSAAGVPTLRQMIMGLTVGEENTPLFHSVDLDWKGVGYVFQFSPELKTQAECTIHTLLPLLQHHFPHSGIEANFTQETIQRCASMQYDEETGAVVDPTVEASMKSLEDDALPGFTLDMSLLAQADKEQRPSRTGFPADVDSVSTLDKRGAKPSSLSFITPATAATGSDPTKATPKGDDSSIVSSTSAITMETIQTIENRLETLQSQVEKTDSRFNELIDLLRQGNGTAQSNGHDQRTEMQIGTSCTTATLDARGRDLSSGNVP